MRYGRSDVAEAAAMLHDRWGQAATAIGAGPTWDEITDLAGYLHAWNEAHAWNRARDNAAEDHWFALVFWLGGEQVYAESYQAPDLRAAWRRALHSWSEDTFDFDRVSVECTARCWDCLLCSHERETEIRQLASAFFTTKAPDPLTGPAPTQLMRPVLASAPA